MIKQIKRAAGSGVPDIFAVWKKKGWEQPEIEELYDPDRTIVLLKTEKPAIKTGDKKPAIKS